MSTTARWIKSGRCTGHGDNTCVELSRNGDDIEFRDSKNRGGTVLRFPEGDVQAFFAQIETGVEVDFEGLIQVTRTGEEYVMSDSRGGGVLVFDWGEMEAFYGGVFDEAFAALLSDTSTAVLVTA